MKNIIYCFTSTGNSFIAAKHLAKYLEGDTEIRFFTNYLNQSSIKVEECDTLGFIFPVYGERAPWPVYLVVSRMKLANKPYVFGIATCNDRGGSALDFFATWLKKSGITMNYTRKITMPGNCMATNDAENKERIADCEMLAGRSAENINRRFISTVEGFDDPNNTADALRERFKNIFVLKADPGKCISCGMCAGICPMNNIEMLAGKPEFHDSCTCCLGCFHWCPAEAVYVDSPYFNNARSRYHHPEITSEQIAVQQKRF